MGNHSRRSPLAYVGRVAAVGLYCGALGGARVSAAVMELHPVAGGAASEIPAVIAGNVNLLRFSEAIARAGLVGRHDTTRGVLVIEAAPARCPECGGTGFDEDARCDLCDGTGREGCART